jgi:hypothetical protein
MTASPNQQVREWVETAERADLLRLVNHMMTSDVRAAVLAYQYVADRRDAAALSDTRLASELARLEVEEADELADPGTECTGHQADPEGPQL